MEMRILSPEEGAEKSKIFDENLKTFVDEINKAFLKKYGIVPEYTYSMNSTPFILDYDRFKYNIQNEYGLIIRKIWK